MNPYPIPADPEPAAAAPPVDEPEPGPEFAAAPPADEPEPEPAPESEPERGPTGHPVVDASLRELAGVAGATPAEQLPAFHAAHRTLHETLASIDEG